MGSDVSDADIFELVLSEWKLTPEYVLENWTEKKLFVLFRSRMNRILRANGKETDPSRVMVKRQVPDKEPPRPKSARKIPKPKNV